MSADLIASVLDRCETELRRIDQGRAPAPGDRSFVDLVTDVARIPLSDWPKVVTEIARREGRRASA
jgi:hypothetical protein